MALKSGAAWRTCADECARVYRRARYRLFAQALRGEGALYERVTALHQRALEGLRREQRLRGSFTRFGATLARARPRLRSWFQQSRLAAGDFLHVEERPLPILLEPDFLLRRLSRPATELILRLRALQAFRGQIEEIFSRSKFTAGNLQYRTSLHRGRSIIEGEDSPCLRSMAGLAHELGHCLAENRALRRQHWDETYSESVAHFFEEMVVRAYLEEQGGGLERAAWVRYQRKVDGCNVFFFQEEARALRGSPRGRPRLFSPRVYVFRESLYTMPGYQLIYARASLTRARWLAGNKSLSSFLPPGRNF